MPAQNFNYSSAFVQYSKGVSLDEISLALAIPLKTLQSKHNNDGWPKLAKVYNEQRGVALQDNRVEIIQANRAMNAEIARNLQKHLLKVSLDMLAGTLKVPRLLKDGSVVSMDPSPSDYASLGAYSKSVSEMSYRAVGDVLVAAPEGGLAASQTPNQIIINLPGAITAPRDSRSYDPQTDILPEPAPVEGSGRNPNVIDAEVVEPQTVESK